MKSFLMMTVELVKFNRDFNHVSIVNCYRTVPYENGTRKITVSQTAGLCDISRMFENFGAILNC